jgi:hypothetical protein
MYCQLYLRNYTVYIPTMGKMGKGFYRGVEPVAVVSASNTEGLRQSLAATIARGNPDVPKLLRREWPPPVLLKYAGVKSWSAFERGMQLWNIVEQDGIYQIAGHTKKPNGMWKEDPEQTTKFPLGISVDHVVERMVAILQAAARNES